MNPIEKFDKASKKLRPRAWFFYVLKLCRSHKPGNIYSSFLILFLSVIVLLRLLFFHSQSLRGGEPSPYFLLLFIPLASLFIGAYTYRITAKESLVCEHKLDNTINFQQLIINAKVDVLKNELRDSPESELKSSTVNTLKEYIDDLLAYPSGGVIFRHPLFLSIVVTPPISAVVSLTVLTLRLDENIETDTLWAVVIALAIGIPLLFYLSIIFSPLVDDVVLGEERFLREMRTLLIMLEAELQEENARTSPTS